MTQLTINIEDKSMLPFVKKLIKSLPGISLAPNARKKKTGIEKAYDDVKAGRVTRWESAEDMFKALEQ